MSSFVALDIETATSSTREVCSLALVRFHGRWPVAQFQAVVRPPCRAIEPRLRMIHGISSAEIGRCPDLREVWRQAAPFLADEPIVVAHNAAFDVPVLRQNLEACGIEMPPIKVVCSLQLSQAMLPALPGHGLVDVAEHLGISDHNHHDALADARTAGLVTVALMARSGCVRPDQLADRVLYGGGDACGFNGETGPAGVDLSGARVVFTGELAIMEREEAEQLVRERRGRPTSSVSRFTTYVVVGSFGADTSLPGKSSKLAKAEELVAAGAPLKIIDEAAFLKMLNGHA